MIKAVFFDVANTLLHKPSVYDKLLEVLNMHGHQVDRAELVYKHKLLSEIVEFPDRTSKQFYAHFNMSLLLTLGIVPDNNLTEELYAACSYLPWQPFEDTKVLDSLTIPMGIISNWDLSLRDKLTENFNVAFTWILGSAELRCRKPDEGLFLKMMEQSQLQPDEIVVVGDSIRLDIAPAIKLNMRAILIDRINLYPNTSLERATSLYDLQSKFGL